MFKINYLCVLVLFIGILGGAGCDEMEKQTGKKYEFDVKLENVSGQYLDWCEICINPPKYDVFFESFGVMPNNIHATKMLKYGIIPNKARLSYLFESEVDKIAEMRIAEKFDEADAFAEGKRKYIEFDIDTSKVPQILKKKDKRPFLIIKIIS